MFLVALVGDRGSGKSQIVNHLVEKHGFLTLHPFEAGKAACRGYFQYCGVDSQTAWRMTNGDLKDTPCPNLPIITDPAHGEVGTHYASRFFMEELGAFMPREMGIDWTIGAVVRKMESEIGPDVRIVLDSLVYEDEFVRQVGGAKIRITTPNPSDPTKGHLTNAKSATLACEHTFHNAFNGIPEMLRDFDDFFNDTFELPCDAEAHEMVMG